ncbi:Kinesin-13A [Hibiscus syriacus]|uniref:Kinesin-like protein n=1 Tax=Hibiscus syriacus TaxID=106335 RepID=A0A6A2Z8L7_HIBSY|nr:Kinesin-13A [Hibiscus syriacus]
MSLVGRRNGKSNSTAHLQRQHSDHFLGVSFNSKCLQSSDFLSSQEFEFYGGKIMSKKLPEQGELPISSRSLSLTMTGDKYASYRELSPGVLDLYSFILNHFPRVICSKLQASYIYEPYQSTDKLSNRPRGMAENNLKSISVDKERPTIVAKIKVVVDLTEYVEKHEFLSDAVLNEGVGNEEVYSQTVEPVVRLIFNRTKATCFAYGQGSGKTYTMQPLPLKAAQDILRLMRHSKLFMREDGKQQVCIVGLQEYKVLDVVTIKELIERGNATRSTGTTGANEESSRSHAILQLTIKRSADGTETKPARLVGKLSFIDLAGSERGADTTDNDKQTRGSKLTEVLRDSFVGDSRTVMISCISPSSGSCEHTLNTLRYADRVKSLSKGNNSKRDTLSSSSNLRESTALPLASSLSTDTFEDILTVGHTGGLKGMAMDSSTFDDKNSHSDDDLNALLKEEEDLVSAHRRQLEHTTEIAREEMNLLVEVEQPGNQLDSYVTKLDTILS